MKKFLLGSIALMLLLYAMTLPFVQYYSTVENLSEAETEHAIVSEIQMTNSIGMAVLLSLLLVFAWLSERCNQKR
jgi:putative copper export protein